jgi:hypothetical protein
VAFWDLWQSAVYLVYGEKHCCHLPFMTHFLHTTSKTTCHFPNLAHFNPENWGSMFLQNSGNPFPWSHNPEDHNTKLSHCMKTFCGVCISSTFIHRVIQSEKHVHILYFKFDTFHNPKSNQTLIHNSKICVMVYFEYRNTLKWFQASSVNVDSVLHWNSDPCWNSNLILHYDLALVTFQTVDEHSWEPKSVRNIFKKLNAHLYS